MKWKLINNLNAIRGPGFSDIPWSCQPYSYLLLRSFSTVKYDVQKSSLLLINLDVPQNSILSPLLFLIFINDLGYISDLNCKIFVDVITLFELEINVSSLISKFKNELEPLFEWCNYNKSDISWSQT